MLRAGVPAVFGLEFRGGAALYLILWVLCLEVRGA